MASQNPISVFAQFDGGKSSALNITAATLIKSSPGVLYRILSSAPGSAGVLTINDSNALVTAQTITGITQAANGVVTLSTGGASNPFAVGNTITFASIVGMTQLNGLVGTVTAIGGVTTAWTVTFNINTSAFTAWASAGTASSFGVDNQIISIPFGSLTSTPATITWPCQNGILVSAVPSAGSPIVAISYF
jgi:hypothetical protein